MNELDPIGVSEIDGVPRLWPLDTGVLGDRSRRALVELVKGPYLSRARSKENWAALLADEPSIRSRLADLYLDLVVDRDAEVAFVRNAPVDGAPNVVRTESLTFMDTAMLLALRHALLTDEGHSERVIIGRDELYETLSVYRTNDRDDSDFRKRLNASWQKMLNKLRVIHALGEDRAEISPVVRLLIDADQVKALRAAYDRIVAGEAPMVSAEPIGDDNEAGE